MDFQGSWFALLPKMLKNKNSQFEMTILHKATDRKKHSDQPTYCTDAGSLTLVGFKQHHKVSDTAGSLESRHMDSIQYFNNLLYGSMRK